MAFAVVVSRMGGPSILPAIGVRAALLHGNSPCNEKWDNKWKSVGLFLLLPLEDIPALQFLVPCYYSY
jgi:hypothetical protein